MHPSGRQARRIGATKLGVAVALLPLCTPAAMAMPREIVVEVAAASQTERNPSLRDDDDWRPAARLAARAVVLSEFGSDRRDPSVVSPSSLVVADDVAPPAERLELGVSAVRFEGADELDDDRLDASYRRAFEFATGRIEGRLGYSDRDAITSNLEFGTGGLRDDGQRRADTSGSVDGTWWLDEDIAIVATVGEQRVRYRGGGATGLTDYDLQFGALDLQWDWNEYTRFGIGLDADQFAATSTGSPIAVRRREETRGVHADLVRALGPATVLRVALGLRHTDSQVNFRLGALRAAASETRKAVQGEVTLRHGFEHSDVGLSIGRSRRPSGVGAQFEQDRYELFARCPVDELTTASLSVQREVNRLDADGGNVPDERLDSAQLSVEREVSEFASWIAGIGYREQDVSSRQADGWQIRFEWRYRFAPVAL